MTALTRRFTDAVDYARIAHAAQFRKGSGTPYLYHLISVAGLVLEYGGSEDQAIAGLLHDVLEDCGAEHDATLRAQFGSDVAQIVKDCTDGTPDSKQAAQTPEAKFADWINRKLTYVAHIEGESMDSLLVTACDKLHNARAIVADLHGDAGEQVFNRFKSGRTGTLQYYDAIARILLKRAASATPRFHELAREFDRTVGEMHQLAGAQGRVPLSQGSLASR